jgi:periplasmic divalent cation tolerance protein
MLDVAAVACANILGPVRSLFNPRGERSEAEGTGVLFKADAAMLERAIAQPERSRPGRTRVSRRWPWVPAC